MKSLRECFYSSPFRSIKLENYFEVYERELARFQGKKIVLVEIGVLDGGSLFMWRDFFGTEVRIVGIDANPLAKRWEKFGFEIEIGDQASPQFWEGFFKKIGRVDLLIDDGGHTNRQQSCTLINCINYIQPGGLIIIEDTHSSYLREFGNPSASSITEFSKLGIDAIQARFPQNKINLSNFSANVWSIRFYESIIVFEINPKKCKENLLAENAGEILSHQTAEDFRYHLDNFFIASLRNYSTKGAFNNLSFGNTHNAFKFLNIILKFNFSHKLFLCLLTPVKYFSLGILRIVNGIENLKVKKDISSYLQSSERIAPNERG